jgi:hypothetical protein
LPNPTVAGIKGKAVFAVVQFEYTTRNQAEAGIDGGSITALAITDRCADAGSGSDHR